ncbi:MAG: hypothetical protein ABIA63_09015 [bacterium]
MKLLTVIFFIFIAVLPVLCQINSVEDDSLYLELKKKNINQMTPREYDYFMKMRKLEIIHKTRKASAYREEQIRDFEKTSNDEEPAPKKGKSFGRGCVAFGLSLLVFVGIISVVIPLDK